MNRRSFLVVGMATVFGQSSAVAQMTTENLPYLNGAELVLAALVETAIFRDGVVHSKDRGTGKHTNK
jgi:hypothetical protein